MRTHHHRGRSGGWQQSQQPDATDAPDWIAGRLPEGWFTGDPSVVVDREGEAAEELELDPGCEGRWRAHGLVRAYGRIVPLTSGETPRG